MKIPVITLYQPWAQFVAYRLKLIETRIHDKFKSLEGRMVLIHAGGHWDYEWSKVAGVLMTPAQYDIAKSIEKVKPGIICSADVVEFRQLYNHDSHLALIDCSGNPQKRYGLVMNNINLIDPAINCKGSQGIWYYQGDVPYSVNSALIPANAICISCGSTREHSDTGLCENGHDNWLEERDNAELYMKASLSIGISMQKLIQITKSNY